MVKSIFVKFYYLVESGYITNISAKILLLYIFYGIPINR